MMQLPSSQSRNFTPSVNHNAFQTNEVYYQDNYYCEQKVSYGQIFKTYEPSQNTNFVNSQLHMPQKAKKLLERKGDWYCKACKNLNFAFRKS
jgi:hypothetical protein